MNCNDDCVGNPNFALDGVCDDGGPNSVYDNCALGTDCTDCGARFKFPPTPPPSPPTAPPPPPPTPPPPLQIFGTDDPGAIGDIPTPGVREPGEPDGDGGLDDVEGEHAGTSPKADVGVARRFRPGIDYRGQTFAANFNGLLPTANQPTAVLDWDLVPVSFLSVACRFGRKLHDGSACDGLSPMMGDRWPKAQLLPAFDRPLDDHTFSGVSYSSDYMARKAAETPVFPWYGYQSDADGDESYGVWTSGPSRIISHAGYLLSFHGGLDGVCPLLRLTYLRPGSRLWRSVAAPFAECCTRGELDRSCLPAWLRAATNSTNLYAPGVLYDPVGNLPDSRGERRMHFSVYYSTAPQDAESGIACIGRVSGRWLGADETCTPTLEWEDDGHPVLCSNSANSTRITNSSERIADVYAGPRFRTMAEWRAYNSGGSEVGSGFDSGSGSIEDRVLSEAQSGSGSGEGGSGSGEGGSGPTDEDEPNEALAYGAEPFYGLDGSLYLVYGAREPGIRIVQLNESSARLPRIAQPGNHNASEATIYHQVAVGPNFELGAETPSPLDVKQAYIMGKINPLSDTTSLVQNAYVLPMTARDGTPEYFMFVEWYGGSDRGSKPEGSHTPANESSLSRVFVGRSRGSPIGPYLDRLGNNMNDRVGHVLGGTRTISIASAVWGANCDGTGYDVSAIARAKCENRESCQWTLRYQELDAIDPLSYSNFDFKQSMQTVSDRYSDTPNDYAEVPGCPRAINITYRCTKHSVVLYEGEILGEERFAFVDGEAANGTVVELQCETPQEVSVPGGSLFADAQRLGGNLMFKTVGHSSVFSYATSAGEAVHVFTFQYHTARSDKPEMGARRIRFAADGWPILSEDHTSQWATCGMPEATYDHTAPSTYFETEAHYDSAHSDEAHYVASSSTRTHCRHHSERGSHCVGSSLRATHPQLGTIGPEGDLLHGRINEEGTTSYWREQEDQCNPLVETQLGQPLTCTRFAGIGDINPTGHITTMERIRGCPRLTCSRKFPCRADHRTRALAGSFDTCTDGLECKSLPELRATPWDSAEFFDSAGAPIVSTRDGLAVSTVSSLGYCSEGTPRISHVNPASGVVQGGTLVTVYGTGFGQPARCRFGWLETAAENVTAHLMYCRAPALNKTHYAPNTHTGPHSIEVERLVRHPVMMEVSMMPLAVLAGAPLTEAVREARGENFTSDRFSYQYFDPERIAISFLRPQGGPTVGSTYVDVHGTGFKPSDVNSNIKCRFTVPGEEGVIVQASYMNADRISCISPNRTTADPHWVHSTAIVTITFNEQEWFGNASYTYYSLHDVSVPLSTLHVPPSVIVSAIHPVGGPARGGTAVTLFGHGFAALDDPGNSLESPINRDLYKLNDGIHDLHRSVISRAGLFCLFLQGGKTAIDVVLPGAVASLDPEWSHGVIPATARSERELVCQTPPFEQLQSGVIGGPDANVTLEITLNGNPDERTASGLLYSFYRDDVHMLPKLHAVQPFGGPAIGGTVLTIYGSLLRRLSLCESGGQTCNEPLCRFGSAKDNTTVPATIDYWSDPNEQMVRCVAPALPLGDERRDVSLNVAQNGQDYVRRALRFRYYPIDKLVVQTLQPSGGPAAGGTTVLLSGQRIGNTHGGLHCRFGRSWVPATSLNDDVVRCIAPALDPLEFNAENATTYPYLAKQVRVTVNNDVRAVSYSSQPFTYFDPEPVLSFSTIYPEAGGHHGGNPVTLVGRGFRDLGGVFCKFGVSAPIKAEAPPPPPPPRPAPGRDGDLRLANSRLRTTGGLRADDYPGSGGRDGRVEIYHNGTWGTVCDDYWGINEARAVCRQLGFLDGTPAAPGYFGPGMGQIWLDNVNCPDDADRLDRCSSQGWGVHNCDHHEDAGVICDPLPDHSSDASPPPGSPPPPPDPLHRLDDHQLMRSEWGAHIHYEMDEDTPFIHWGAGRNESEFTTVVCRSPPLREAIGRFDRRAVARTVGVTITINDDLYGPPINFTYYPL